MPFNVVRCHSVNLISRRCARNTWRFSKWKPASPLQGASIPTIIMENDVWIFGEITDHMRDGVLVSETLHCGSGVVYQKSVLSLHSVVLDLSFKEAMLLATISPVVDIEMALRRISGGGRIEKPQESSHSACMPDNVQKVRDTLLRSLHRGDRRQAFAHLLKDSSMRRILHKELHYLEFLDLINSNCDTANKLLILWISRIVTTGLQTAHVKFLLMVLLAVSLGIWRGSTKSYWENFCEMSYVLNLICHGSNGMELMLTQHRFPSKFSGNVSKKIHFLFWRCQLIHSLLILQDASTSFWAMSKAKYMKHVLSILMMQNSQLWSAFKGSPWKF